MLKQPGVPCRPECSCAVSTDVDVNYPSACGVDIIPTLPLYVHKVLSLLTPVDRDDNET